TALATTNHDPFVVGQLVNQHEPEIMPGPLVLLAGITQTNYQPHNIANCQLPIADSVKIGIRQSEIGNALLGFFALFFLLALANHFGLGRLFALNRHHRRDLFLHDADRGNHDVCISQNLDCLTHRDIGNVKHVMHVEVGNVQFKRVRNLARLATNLNLTNLLLQYTLLLSHADGFTEEVQRHSDFNLLALDQPREVGVNQATLDRIDLPIVKHHFTGADALHI